MANQIKFHKLFGQVEIVSQDEQFIIILKSNGETSKCMTKYTVLSDTPIEVLSPVVRKAKKLNPANFSSASNKIDQEATARHKAIVNETFRKAYEAETGRTGTLEFLKSI